MVACEGVICDCDYLFAISQVLQKSSGASVADDEIGLAVDLRYFVREPDEGDVFGYVNCSELKINYLAPIWLKISNPLKASFPSIYSF